MSNIKILLGFLLICFFACGGDKKPSEGGSFTKDADKIESESNLSAACEKDLAKYGEFLDDARAFIKKRAEGVELTEADEKEWNKKTQALAMEFTTSAGAYTDPNCAIAFSKMQASFNQVMMELARAQM